MLDIELEEFDRILLALIVLGTNTLPKIMSNDCDLRRLVKSSLHANAWRGLGSVPLIVSRRLQALRHRGVIDWNGDVWQVAEPRLVSI